MILRHKNQNGTVVVMVMWILAILSLFAVGLGYRSSIELRLTSFYLDKVRTSYLAQEAVYTTFFHIANDTNRKVDAYNERWGNYAEAFFDKEYDDAKVNVTHLADSNDDEKVILYGASDEMGKININKIPKEIIKSEYWQEEFGFDDDLVKVLMHWRKKNSSEKDLDAWYETTYGYKARHGKIQLLEELHFLKNFYTNSCDKNKHRARLKDIITFWGNGKVNMNTASREVLEALFVMQSAQKEMGKSDREDLIRMIIEYRNGDDGLPGTLDDQLFENVNIETAIGTHDASFISMLNWLRTKQLIGVTSDFFRIDATVTFKTKKLKRNVSAIVSRSKEYAKDKTKKEKKTATVSVVDEKSDEDLDPMRILKYYEE